MPVDADQTPVLRDASNEYGVKRLDTGAVVVAAGTALDDVEGDGRYTFTIPDPIAGVRYAYSISYAIDGEDMAQITGEVTGPGNAGRYWSYQGVENHLGTAGIAIESNLENGTTTADLDRIVADGTKADAYTDMRARKGVKPAAVIPIPNTDPDFAVVREAADLYTAYLLVSHRIYTDASTQDAEAQKAAGLYSRAMKLYGDLSDAMLVSFGTVDLSRDTDRDACGWF